MIHRTDPEHPRFVKYDDIGGYAVFTHLTFHGAFFVTRGTGFKDSIPTELEHLSCTNRAFALDTHKEMVDKYLLLVIAENMGKKE